MQTTQTAAQDGTDASTAEAAATSQSVDRLDVLKANIHLWEVMLNKRDSEGHARSSEDSKRLQSRIEVAQEEVRAEEQRRAQAAAGAQEAQQSQDSWARVDAAVTAMGSGVPEEFIAAFQASRAR